MLFVLTKIYTILLLILSFFVCPPPQLFKDKKEIKKVKAESVLSIMYFKKGVTKIFLWPLFENLKKPLGLRLYTNFCNKTTYYYYYLLTLG